MDSHTDLATARLTGFLEKEPVVWLSTVCSDGRPHLVPVWFSWDGEAITILSKPGAQKVRNIRAHAQVMLALGDAEDDFDVGLVEAHAELLDGTSGLPVEFAAKYGSRITGMGLTTDQFAAMYPQRIRLVPTKALGWHGRSQPVSVVTAARRVAESRPVSINEEPTGGRRPLRDRLGEPLSRGLRGLRPMPRAGVAI